MSTVPISLIILEDEVAHVKAILFAFEDAAPPVEIRVARTLREYYEHVAKRAPDIAILDLNLPDGNEQDVLTLLSESCPFPVLIMTGCGNESVAVSAMKSGAVDYVVKSPEAFADMPRTVRRVLAEWNLSEYSRQAGDQERAYAILREMIRQEGRL